MIQKTEYFYNASSGKVAKIPASWDEAVRAAQEELLLSQGYGPVRDYEPPRSRMPFATVEEVFSANGDGTYTQTLSETPLPVKLSQEKLLRHPAIQTRLDDLMGSLAGDAELSYWWTSDLRYLRGSPMAQRAMQVFGMTQDQIEQIVLACRA